MRVMSLFLCLPLVLTSASAREAPLPPDRAFALSWQRQGDQVRLNWRMPKGYYLYRAHIEAKDASGRPLSVKTPAGRIKPDPTFGPTEVYYGTARASLRHAGPVRLTYRGCQEDGLCYIPITVVIPALQERPRP
ncbi:cytochrome c-type biogenesis protein DsbD [Asticcacaulis excentricus]|uniref:Cytochrome c-type biogenesis protein DsbD n=2 Tax=Asticcacaulis excentricus TaxID=78587 RepID=A0A3G9G5I0_9CAUL|nr:cytochrome c-type biogenesis protein DsbD [Asticcacaulis excentricus]